MTTFFDYVASLTNPEGKDPVTQLANQIYADRDFPKHSQEFDEISNYLEGNSDYSRRLATFDRIWQDYRYQYDL